MPAMPTNVAALTALTSLKAVSAHLATTANRVATGLRVSAASDDATYWSLATSARTDNAALRAVGDTLGLGATAFDTAAAGLDSVLGSLRRLRATLQVALAPGTDRAKVQTEITAIQAQMRATADASGTAGQNWLSVDSASGAYRSPQEIVTGIARDPSGTATVSTFPVDVEALKLYDANPKVTGTEPEPAAVSSSTPLAMTAPFAGTGRANFTGTLEASFLVTTGGRGDVIKLNGVTLASQVGDLSAVTPSELTDAINAQIARSPALSGKVVASLTADGRLSLATTATGAAASLTLQADQPTAGSTTADLGIVTLPERVAISPMVFATSPYATIDLSGANTKTVTLGDGASSITYTFDASSQPPPANRAAVTFAEMSAMFLRERRRVDADFYMVLTNYGGQDRFVATTRFGGPTSSITVSGPDAAAFGFTPGQSAVGSEHLGYSPPRTGTGSDGSQSTPTRGLLDTAGSSGYAIATVDVSGLSGSSGEAVVLSMVRDVEAVMAKVTDGGARLGAGKTLVEGQRVFINTLVKTNERTIGALVDADIEEEAAKLKALQAQQQLAVLALSIANASSRNLLTLFN